MNQPEITVLIDNHACRQDLQCQHGLSLWLEAAGRKILIDTGNSGDFLANADKLGIRARDAEFAVITHGHWDHTGGMPDLLALGGKPLVVMHPKAWQQRRAAQGEEPFRDIGISWSEQLLTGAGIEIRSFPAAGELLPGIWSTGPILDWYGLDEQAVLQVKVGDQWRPDPFADEQALVLETVSGLVVISGCSHRGILNILRAAQLMTGVGQVHTLIGGLHLKDASSEECEALAERLSAFALSNLWINHCTGEPAYEILKARLGEMVQWAGGGFSAQLPPLIRK